MKRETLLSKKDINIIAQSQLEGFQAVHILDDREDTFWRASPYYQWLRLDLNKGCYITMLRLDTGNHSDRYYHYYIECSNDNINWNVVVEKMDDSIPEDGIATYELNCYARYIRITMTYCSRDMSVQIRNLHIYGYETVEMEEQQTKVAGLKMAAIKRDEEKGFIETEVDNIEYGQKSIVMEANSRGSYLKFQQVDFAEVGVDQLRGNFGFPSGDREKRIVVQIRLDSLDGEVIGEMVLFRQYKPWSILACEIKRQDGTSVTGVHDVYIVIVEEAPPQVLMIQWLSFVKKTPLPTPAQKEPSLSMEDSTKYEIYFGNLHCHTAFSDGKAVPEYAYDHARYIANIDFLAITEHSNLYDEAFDFDKSRKWADMKAFAEKKTEDGAFLALYGSETTWYNQFGHMNTYNIDFYLNAYELEYNDITHYYNTLKQHPNSINQWNHPWSCGKRHLDYFEPYDEELDKVLYTIEINHLECPEQDGLEYYMLALDKGWHVCPVGSQDNHNEEWGDQNHIRTGALMEKLTTEHLYDAIQNYRVYFTSAINLKVWFHINDRIMGSRIDKAEKYKFNIKAQNKEEDSAITRIEIIGQKGQILHTLTCDSHLVKCNVTLTDESPYYFLKIYQANGEFAATAPIWIENKE